MAKIALSEEIKPQEWSIIQSAVFRYRMRAEERHADDLCEPEIVELCRQVEKLVDKIGSTQGHIIVEVRRPNI